MAPLAVLAGLQLVEELTGKEFLLIAPAVLDGTVDRSTDVNSRAGSVSGVGNVLKDVTPVAVLAGLKELPSEKLFFVTAAVLDCAVDGSTNVDGRTGSVSGVGNVLENMAPVAVLASLEFFPLGVLGGAGKMSH